MKKEQVYKELREAIITQKRPAGSVLDEKSLMHEFSIGRTPLREVFIELQRDGLINMIPRMGTFVTQLDIEVLRSDIEIRGALEEIVASLLVQRMTRENLDTFRVMLDQGADMCKGQQESVRFSKILLYESDIHQFLYECTKNRLLPDMMKRIQVHSLRYWHTMKPSFDDAYQQFKSLYKVYEALEKRDVGEAKRCARMHTEEFATMVQQHLLSDAR